MARTKQTARFPHAHHICGCYYVVDTDGRCYLPQVSLKSHCTITSRFFTTKLEQTFYNPQSTPLSKVTYTFPLYDGVTINGYTISYADKVLQGVVEQKHEAQRTFQAAVDRGETAGLLQALPVGVFGVTLGNIPPKTDVVVHITYCGELKHDAGIDGLRYNLPTSIAPRYGSYPGTVLSSNSIPKGGISIIVDVDTADAPIRRVQSPSHPIAVSMGELSVQGGSSSTPAPYTPSRASATLTLGTAELAGDFVLQLIVDRVGEPQAVIEKHPSLPNQRAIMTTLVPKYTLQSEHPEIVFVADQSGSMAGSKTEALKAALTVFLKSLPFGVRFNICAFGSTHRFLWPKSQAYNEMTVKTALAFIENFSAQYGGTDIYNPVKAVFGNRLKDLPLEIMLLTDGEIWAEDVLFRYINDEIIENKVDARVFALGIGSDVSHTLVEGVARAGNGFAQFVTTGSEFDGVATYEDLDQKIVRMLKAALFAHTHDYKLEVHYANEDAMANSDDDFELVEKVADGLSLEDIPVPDQPASRTRSQTSRSFYDPNVNPDEPAEGSTNAVDRYAHLPPIDVPKILQAPSNIPPLAPFNRTTAYLLLGPESPQNPVRSITLRARSAEGPLEVEIPVQDIGEGSTVHQLAARKAMLELEEGRGWLSLATVGPNNEAAKTKLKNRYDEVVEREAVRLGVTYQVAGKWTSFVAVEKKVQDTTAGQASSSSTEEVSGSSNNNNEDSMQAETDSPAKRQRLAGGEGAMQSAPPSASSSGTLLQQQISSALMSQMPGPQQAPGPSNTSFMQKLGGLFGGGGGLKGGSGASNDDLSSSDLHVDMMVGQQMQNSQFSTAGAAPRMQMASMPAPPAARVASRAYYAPAPRKQLASKAARRSAPSAAPPTARSKKRVSQQQRAAEGSESDEDDQDDEGVERGIYDTDKAPEDLQVNEVMRCLIGAQDFSGAWTWAPELLRLLRVDPAAIDKSKFGEDERVAATILVIAWLGDEAASLGGAWEMVVDKAKAWLRNHAGVEEEKLKELVSDMNACRKA